MSIRCGHCGNSHESIGVVRTCSTINPLAQEYEAPAYDSEPDLPKPVSAQQTADGGLEEGKIYLFEEEMYRLRRSKSTGHLYAMQISTSKNKKEIYAPGIASQINPDNKVDIEELKKLGKETDICVLCGRQLTNPASIEAGIGPICAGGYGG